MIHVRANVYEEAKLMTDARRLAEEQFRVHLARIVDGEHVSNDVQRWIMEAYQEVLTDAIAQAVKERDDITMEYTAAKDEEIARLRTRLADEEEAGHRAADERDTAWKETARLRKLLLEGLQITYADWDCRHPDDWRSDVEEALRGTGSEDFDVVKEAIDSMLPSKYRSE